MLTIANSLLRADGPTGDPPPPFERPQPALAFWVLEIPGHCLSLPAWQTETTILLRQHAALLARARAAGATLTLFVEWASPTTVLRLPADFLRLLTAQEIDLECACAGDDVDRSEACPVASSNETSDLCAPPLSTAGPRTP